MISAFDAYLESAAFPDPKLKSVECATELKTKNIRILGDGIPKNGAHDKQVVFLHPKDFFGTLIELEQE